MRSSGCITSYTNSSGIHWKFPAVFFYTQRTILKQKNLFKFSYKRFDGQLKSKKKLIKKFHCYCLMTNPLRKGITIPFSVLLQSHYILCLSSVHNIRKDFVYAFRTSAVRWYFGSPIKFVTVRLLSNNITTLRPQNVLNLVTATTWWNSTVERLTFNFSKFFFT